MKRRKAGKAQKMKDLSNDTKSPRFVRGWINQEIKRKQKKYKNKYSKVRPPPGYNLAHFRGFEAAKGFDYRFSSLQSNDLHLLQHKYDHNGIKNKTPKNIKIQTGKNIPSFRSRSACYDFFSKLNKAKAEFKLKDLNDIIAKGNDFNDIMDLAIDIYGVISCLMSGDLEGAIMLIGEKIGSMGGEKIGRLIGKIICAKFGCAYAGGLIGGIIGNYLGSMIGKLLCETCIKGAGLNENNNKTGGVEIRLISSLTPLKKNIFFLFSQINLIAFPFNSKIPKIIETLLPGVEINNIVHRIIYEIYFGIVVYNAPILFSLHFAKEGFLYPVIHPYYRNTLTGYILGFLDYFLKGFINGGIYKPEFLLEWDKEKNMDSDYLIKNVFDIREELKKDNLQSLEYLSLRELYDDDEESNNGKQKYFSAFRILGKTKTVHTCGSFLIPDCDFDVEHDLNPSIEVIAELSKSTPSEYHAKHELMEKAYQRMHDQIHNKMSKIPLFAPWFDLLKIVSFGAHYVQTLIETGIQPCIPEPDLIEPFPTAMPPIPIRKVKTFQIDLSFYDFMEQISPDVIKTIDDHLYKIMNNDQFDFKLIENVINDEARKIIIKKLSNHLPIQQIEQRDDSELHVQQVSIIIEKIIEYIISIPSIQLLDTISNHKDHLTDEKSFEILLNDIKKLPFKQQLDFLRQKLQPIIQQNDFQTILNKLEDIEEKYNMIEENKEIAFSFFVNLAKTNDQFKDNMKNIVLLNQIRLAFIDIGLDSSWSQNIRGGCSVNTFVEPEVVQEQHIPFEMPLFENKNFETQIQNYFISGIKIEHRWYASPQSFVENSIELKDDSSSIDANVLGGKRIIDFIIETGNIDLLRTLNPENINSPGIDGFSPLLTAVALSNYELVKVLLEEFHADFNFKHPNGLTPLIVATQSGYTEISLLLLEQPGIDIDVSLDTGMSPMHFAISNSDVAVIKKLTQLGLNADSEKAIRNKDGCNPFLYAAKLGFFKGLESMTVKNQNCCSADGSNALHWAAGSNFNSLKCIEILYNKFNVSSDIQNCRKQYPLHVAIEARNDDSAIFLYDIFSKCASYGDDRNKTPKELAIAYRAVGFLSHAFPNESLIDKIMQKEVQNLEDAIQDAIFRLNLPDTTRLINELSKQKNNLKILEKIIKAVLIVGSDQLLDIVVRATPDIKNAKFSNKMVLPHLVVRSGQDKLIKTVSKFGFTFDEKDGDRNTPIFYAVASDDSKTMKKILKCRENSDNLMNMFRYAAQKSFENRKVNCINALLKFQKKCKNHILINGSYLCNNLNVTSTDVNNAINMGLEIKKEDILMAAAKSNPEVLTLIIQHFLKENYPQKNDIIKECIKTACDKVRIDNILALHQIYNDRMNNIFVSISEEIKAKKEKYAIWLIEALAGDPKSLIKKKIQEIKNLLDNGIDISLNNCSGIRNKMFNILQHFPLKNIKIEDELPYLHYAIGVNAIWAFSCLPKNYDITQKINGCTAYDYLPFSSGNLLDSFWDSPDIDKILESLTFKFAGVCLKYKCSNKFISSLCKTIAKKSRYLKNSTLLHILIHSKASFIDLEQIIISRNDWCRSVDENGMNPLMHAALIHNYELAKLIIKNIPSQDIENRDYNGNNVLHQLILESDSEDRHLLDFSMELISKCPQLLKMVNKEGKTPLALAAFKGYISLLALFGSFDYFDSEIAVHSAASGNQVNVIKFILNSDCSSFRIDPNIRLQHLTNKLQEYGDNFIHTAAKYNSVEAFIELVRLGTNPMEVNCKNIMPIEIALRSKNFKMIEFIIKLPSLLNASSLIKGRAITSCAAGSSKIIKGLDVMIKCGYPIASIDIDGNPLIHCASLSDNADAIHLVLNAGADILAVTTFKMTVLHLCALRNKPNALRTCLDWASFCISKDEYWKWINAKNTDECTALHLAASSNNDSCVSILLAYGADPKMLNSKKLTPAQLSVVSNSLDALGILKQVANDNTFNGTYPLEYTEIVKQFKEKMKKKELSIPQKLDDETIKRLQTFPNQIKQRLIPLDDDDINEYKNENDGFFNDYNNFSTEIITSEEFKTEFDLLFEEKSAEILDKFSLYPLAQIKLILLIEYNPQIIDELDSIINNLEIEKIVSILPDIPTNALIPFIKTINEVIKISNQCTTIWEWFQAYFRCPCNQSNYSDEIEVPKKDDFTEPFDYLIMILNETKCYNYLPWPKLPKLSVFNGKMCSMLTIKKVLSQCTDKILQIKNINDIPLNNEKIDKLISYSYKPKYFGNSFLWCRDGSIILDNIKNIQKDGSFNSFKIACSIDAFALLTIRAMFTGVIVSNLINDFRNEKEDTKCMIINIALQLNQSDFLKVREWCAAGLLCSEQFGSSILKQLCDLISKKKYSIFDILYIFSIMSRLSDTKKIETALNSSNPKEQIFELMSKEINSKSYKTIINEMSTSLKRDFQPYKYAFDGTPLFCLPEKDISSLDVVYDEMISMKPPSTMREIQAEVANLGKEMLIKPNLRSLGKLLAILSHSFEVIFKIKPYLIQCMTVAGLVLSEIHPIKKLKGRIAQVATGEGKSIDIVLLASICAAQGRYVDIITSTHYLAKRDYLKYAPYYNFIGLSCGCIAKDPEPSTEDFNGLILYGINTDFEFTILREGISGQNIQKTQKSKDGPLEIRIPDTIITDESDNLFIDNAINSARISWKSNENVSWVFAPLYNKLLTTKNCSVKEVRKFLLGYLKGKFAQQVSNWSDEKLQIWISSFFYAQNQICGRDYVIGINEITKQKEIQIVHLGTGRIQHNSRWSNGVHEFIEAREGLIPKNETYTIASISHPAFFGRYKQIYGLTGTAGELVERNEVMKTYHVDTFDVPPNRKCLRKILPTKILSNNKELQEYLIKIVIETQKQLRPLLLLFLSIEDTIKFSNKLSLLHISHMVLNEIQREDEDYIVFRAGQPGVVTIATNTAGRGTDIVLSSISKENGGLRVAFTFFPDNFRIECQGLGRAGRQGQPGTAEIITSLEDPSIIQLIGKINSSILLNEDFVKMLYQKRSDQIESLSKIRMLKCINEVNLFTALSLFFKKFKLIKDSFLNDNSIQNEFENIGINSLIIWTFLESKLQQEWAKVFSYFCQNSNIDRKILNQYNNKFIKPLLRKDSKTLVQNAINIYEKNIIIYFDEKPINDNKKCKVTDSEYNEYEYYEYNDENEDLNRSKCRNRFFSMCKILILIISFGMMAIYWLIISF